MRLHVAGCLNGNTNSRETSSINVSIVRPSAPHDFHSDAIQRRQHLLGRIVLSTSGVIHQHGAGQHHVQRGYNDVGRRHQPGDRRLRMRLVQLRLPHGFRGGKVVPNARIWQSRFKVYAIPTPTRNLAPGSPIDHTDPHRVSPGLSRSSSSSACRASRLSRSLRRQPLFECPTLCP